MKQVTNMSRLVNQLEKMFRALNADMFNNELDTPVITVTPTSRAYAHYTPWNAWEAGDIHRREINIASGTLNRPLEDITASLLHEMVHMYNDTVLNIQDTSRGGTYHNKEFAKEADIECAIRQSVSCEARNCVSNENGYCKKGMIEVRNKDFGAKCVSYMER